MKDNKNKALTAGIWYTICNFFVKGLTFLTMPIFTRIMSTSDIGMFSNITSWFNILAIITTFEIYSSVSIARFDYKDDFDSYISSSLFLGTIITAIYYIIVLIFHNFFQDLFMMNFETLNIIFIYLLVYPAIQMFQIKNQIKYNYKSTIIITILNAIFSSFFSILLVLLMTNSLRGRIIGYFVPLIINSLVIYVIIMIRGKSISKKYWKYAIKISFPLIWHLLAGYLLSSADKIMITKLISPDANAIYSVAYTISQIAFILWTSMNNAWSPWAYSMMDKKDYDSLKNNSKPYTIFFVIVVLVMLLITPELLLIMGGEAYISAKYVMPPVMIGYIFQFIYSLYVNIEFYHKKQKNIALGTIIAAIINIVLNYIFIPIFGYIAAAYTTLIGYAILMIIHYLFVKKLKCDYWYDKKFFLKIIALSLIILIISNLLYAFLIIRYIIVLSALAILFIILYRSKNRIIVALKKKSIIDLINVFNIRKEQ